MKIYLYFLFVITFFQSCNKCRYSDSNETVHYFEKPINNIVFLENKQSTYALNDTVWFKIEIPESFKDEQANIECNISTNELLISEQYLLIFTDTDSMQIPNSLLIFREGSNPIPYFNLIKKVNTYSCSFGVVLNNVNYKALSFGYNRGTIDIYTKYDYQFCDPPSKCYEYKRPFSFRTTITGLDDNKFSFTVVP